MSIIDNYKKYAFIAFSIFSFNLESQVIDESILSQLSPMQIEMAKNAFAGSNSSDVSIEELPPIDESTCDNKVVGILINLIPRLKILAAKPTTSPVIPPPKAIM